METQNFIDKAYVHQCIDKIEELLSINDEYTPREIEKLTETMTSEEQQLLIDEWATIYFYDCEPELITPKRLKQDFFLHKIQGD